MLSLWSLPESKPKFLNFTFVSDDISDSKIKPFSFASLLRKLEVGKGKQSMVGWLRENEYRFIS